MLCIPLDDKTYRRAARLAGIPDFCLAPVEDEELEDKRIEVDALLLEALSVGLSSMEMRQTRA